VKSSVNREADMWSLSAFTHKYGTETKADGKHWIYLNLVLHNHVPVQFRLWDTWKSCRKIHHSYPDKNSQSTNKYTLREIQKQNDHEHKQRSQSWALSRTAGNQT